MSDLLEKFKLNNGIEMPALGLGVLGLKTGGETEHAVKTALLNGYRLIDTASAYHNEEGVAQGIKASGVPREEIFITSKLDNNDQGYKNAFKAFNRTLKRLQTDYLDLYLIHWPRGKKSLATWKAMEELVEQGKIRAIGLSNFDIHHLDYFLPECKIIPAVNQVELHPEYLRPELQNYCKQHQIQLEAWSPLMQGRVADYPEIREIAEKYGKTPFQVVLRWNLQKEIVTIPGSGNPTEIASNARLFDFELNEKDLAIIDGLDRNTPITPRRERLSYLLEMMMKRRNIKTLFSLVIKTINDKFSIHNKSFFTRHV